MSLSAILNFIQLSEYEYRDKDYNYLSPGSISGSIFTIVISTVGAGSLSLLSKYYNLNWN